MINFEEDAQFAKYLAQGTGEILLDLQADLSLCSEILGDKGDKNANDFIIREVKTHRPNDAILSEESIDDFSRLNKSRVWIIDPLDGTREFCERRKDWAVHIALCIDKQPILGVVAIPSLGEVFESKYPPKLKALNSPIKIVASRTRPCENLEEMAQFFNAEKVLLGSAGVKAMAVLKGDADVYVHIGNQSEWDNCAPIAVALAAGLHASHIDGTIINYNNRDIIVPNLLICRKELANQILDYLGQNSIC